MAAVKLPPSQLVLNECLIVVVKAAREGGIVYAAQEARRIHNEHPNAGMTEERIGKLLIRMAIERRLSIDGAG